MCAQTTNHRITDSATLSTSPFNAERSIANRFNNLTPWDINTQLSIRTGTLADYRTLSRFHYRSARPGAPTRVLVLQTSNPPLLNVLHNESNPQSFLPPVTSRTLYKPLSVPTNTNLRSSQTIVGVLVESLPALSCQLRDYALNSRYASFSPRERAQILNHEVRCISRVVIHPQYRGLSLAVRLVKQALRTATTRFTEALAAMGNVNPFFEHAGMTTYHRAQHERDARLAAALNCVGITELDLVRTSQTINHLRNLPTSVRTWIYSELLRWYPRPRKPRPRKPHPRKKNVSSGGINRENTAKSIENRAQNDESNLCLHNELTASDWRNLKGSSNLSSEILAELLNAARKRVFFQPVYYLKVNSKSPAAIDTYA